MQKYTLFIYIVSFPPFFFIPIFAGIRHSDSPMRCGVGVEMMVRVELWVDVGVGMMAWVELCVGVGVGLMVWNVVWVGVGEGLMVRA